jgi:hypothetical protein
VVEVNRRIVGYSEGQGKNTTTRPDSGRVVVLWRRLDPSHRRRLDPSDRDDRSIDDEIALSSHEDLLEAMHDPFERRDCEDKRGADRHRGDERRASNRPRKSVVERRRKSRKLLPAVSLSL